MRRELREQGLYLCDIENRLNGKKYKLLQMSHIYRARKEHLSNEDLLLHEHTFCELFFVTNGNGKMLLGGAEIPIAEGDLLIVSFSPASLPHESYRKLVAMSRIHSCQALSPAVAFPPRTAGGPLPYPSRRSSAQISSKCPG